MLIQPTVKHNTSILLIFMYPGVANRVYLIFFMNGWLGLLVISLQDSLMKMFGRHVGEALPLYRRALQLSEAGTPPAALFRADRSFLLSHGLKVEDLQLAADLLEANLP